MLACRRTHVSFLAALVCAGCFSATFLQGHPCTKDSECAGLGCVDGYCGGPTPPPQQPEADGPTTTASTQTTEVESSTGAGSSGGGECALPEETESGNDGDACPVGDHCVECTEAEGCITKCACAPAQHAEDTLNCGCAGPCAAGQTCVDEECRCDPEQHTVDSVDCACMGPCEEREMCSPCADDESCVASCVCDPAAHTDTNWDCGCTGPCPGDEMCVPCGDDERCVAKCECDPTKHLVDVDNCGCEGPCLADEKCVACDGGEICYAECVCNELEHLTDSTNCGCMGPCVDGAYCDGGTCICPPESFKCLASPHLAPNLPKDAVTCIPNNDLQGSYCLDCFTVCPPSEQCVYQYVGDTIIDVGCDCDPTEHTNDVQNCGCEGQCPAAVNEQMICSAGQCICPPGTYKCTPPGNVVPELMKNQFGCFPVDDPSGVWCDDCYTFCVEGSSCDYIYNDNDDIVAVQCII